MKHVRSYLRKVIEQDDTPLGKGFDLFIQFLIFFSIITFSIETIPDLKPETRKWLVRADVICVAIFTLEYLLRIYVARKPLRYIFSLYGFIDLMAILPYMLPAHIDLRSLRALRFIRLVRLLKLVRYNHALQRFEQALRLAKEEIILFVSLTLVLLYFSAIGIYYFEHETQPDKFSSIFESLWWAVATLTTVGYGDVVPVTLGGKIFTFCVLILGLGIIAMPAGLISSALSKVRQDELEALIDNKRSESSGYDTAQSHSHASQTDTDMNPGRNRPNNG